MAERLEYDVVVAGAGMTGAAFALALAQAGLDVAVVDGRALEPAAPGGPGPAPDGRASAITFANFRLFRTLGLGEALEPAQPIKAILVSDAAAPGAASRQRSGTFLRFDSAELGESSEGDAEPLAWMVENSRIRSALAEALRSSRAEVFAPAQVSGLETDARAARLRLADGRVLSAPLVVGAEGRASVVRQAAGADFTGWNYPAAGVVATVQLEASHEGVAHEIFMADGALAILPLTGNRASLVWVEPTARAEALVAASDPAFEAHLGRRFGAFLGRPRLIGARHAFPLSLGVAERIAGARFALIGDAAHVIHPIAGQGLNLGLKDAAALAEVVVEARRLGEDWGSEGVTQRYARWRRFDTMTFAAVADLFTRLYAPADPITRLGRSAVMGAMGKLPGLRRAIMREAGGALGDLPRLLRGEPLG